MTTRLLRSLTGALLSMCLVLITACASPVAGPTPGAASIPGPRVSPRPAFTGLAVPATLPAPSKTAVPTQTKVVAGSATTRALTILYTNDTRGFVDPCG
jgi:hypothetical protein